MIPWAAIYGTPIALRTWECFEFLEARSEPAEAANASLASEAIALGKVTIEAHQ
jgi:hypothetical protein